MKNYIHKMDSFPELFEKLCYKEEKLSIPYTIMMIDIVKKEKMEEFGDLLLHYLELSDTIYAYSKTKFIIVLEDTSIKEAIIKDEKFRKKIRKHGYKRKIYSAAIQGNSIEDVESLEKALKRRLKKSKKCKKTDFIHSLSTVDGLDD